MEDANNKNQKDNQYVSAVDNETLSDSCAAEASKPCVCRNELAQLQAKLIHIVADFDNFKRRTEKERISWIYNAQSQVISDLLTVVDDFDRALQNYRNNSSINDSMMQGVEMIYQALEKILEKYDVSEIETSGMFDPEKHEALAQVESLEKEGGAIVDVLQRGFVMKERILRPAKVTVAK